MSEIANFFNDVSTHKSSSFNKEWRNIIFICCHEFNWSQEVLFNTDIPFLLDALSMYMEVKKKESDALKKSRRKK